MVAALKKAKEPKMEQKYKQIKINVLPLEYNQIQEKAKSQNLKLSGYVRSVLNVKNDLDIKKSKSYTPCDPILLREINKIGNNLNQVAKHLNIKKVLDINVLESLEQIEKYTKSLLENELKKEV